MQGRPTGFKVLSSKRQCSMDLGQLEWPRENVETSVLHQFIP
jgi:hypothetical protein